MSQKYTLRKKIILGLTGCLAMIYVFVEYVGEPLYREQKRQEQKIENKILFISKYHEILNQKSYYQEKEKANQRLSAELHKLFLSASHPLAKSGLLAKLFPPPLQPALAAAGLQKSLEDKARKTRVNLVQVKTEKTKYMEGLLTIPVRITVKSSLEKLSRFIRMIESDNKFLVIEELVIRRINKREPEQLESRLLVNGFIQQRKPGKLKET
jgi:Type II secretion system (T2SS), protein M subtype b